MLTTDDPRLCKNYRCCRSYGASYLAKKSECSGCMGSIKEHRALMDMVDKYLDPLAAQVHHRTGEDITGLIIEVVTKLKQELDANNLEVSITEASLLLQQRSLMRLQDALDTVKLGQR